MNMTVGNENIKFFEMIDERDLHAYVDGFLEGQRAKKVEEYLKRNPDKAAEVQDYIKYNKLIRKVFEHETEKAVPQRLLSVLNRPASNMWPAVGRVAAVLILCALSAGGGWLSAYHNSGTVLEEDSTVGNFVNQIASNARPSFSAIPVQKLEIHSNKQTDPLNWLTQKVALEMQAPDLTQAGYTLEGRRLLHRGSQEFVELQYVNASGNTVRLYMKTRWEKEAPIIEFAQKDNQSIAYWQEGPLVYALSGTIDQNNAVQIAKLVRKAMTELPDEKPHVQNVQILTPMSSQIQPQTDYSPVPSVPVTQPARQNVNAIQHN